MPFVRTEFRSDYSFVLSTYRYFDEKGCQKNCAVDNPKRWYGINISIRCSWHCRHRTCLSFFLLLSFNTRKHTSLTSCVFLSNFLEIKTQNHPQYLSGLSRTLFPTTFLEIAINRLSWNSRPCLKMADWLASCRYLALLIAVFVHAICTALLIRVNKGYGYMLWFNFIIGLNFIFLCFWVW